MGDTLEFLEDAEAAGWCNEEGEFEDFDSDADYEDDE
jgi:hypothetical protein